MSAAVTAPVVVLVGAPGAGKTTVGRQVAARLGVSFRDTDTDVEAAAGKPISDIFIDEGEQPFRAREQAAVEDALRTHEGVLALGGGAVLSAETRALLRGHRVVQLEVDLSSATSRVGLNRDRPVLALNPRAVLKGLLEQRAPLYREVAGAVVPTSRRSVEQVVDDVLAALAAPTGLPRTPVRPFEHPLHRDR